MRLEDAHDWLPVRLNVDVRNVDEFTESMISHAWIRWSTRRGGPLRGAASPRLGGRAPAGGLPRQRPRHAQRARGVPAALPRGAVRVHVHEQGLWGAMYDCGDDRARRRASSFAPDWDDEGIDEECRVDQTMHSLYGAGKLAADIYVQEYGRYYGMRTVCLRAGCITGAGHAAVAAHGFLSYLVKCNVAVTNVRGEGLRRQAGARQPPRRRPRPADRHDHYWSAGDRQSRGRSTTSAAARRTAARSSRRSRRSRRSPGRPMIYEHDPEPRRGDHACYYTDLRKVHAGLPGVAGGARPAVDLRRAGRGLAR